MEQTQYTQNSSTSQQGTDTRTPTTNDSLLSDLAKNPDSERIDEFARIYEPVMRRYARQAQKRLRGGLSESDRDDLVQEAFIAVRHALSQFNYDRSKGKFRHYLSWTIRHLAEHFSMRNAERPVAPETITAISNSAEEKMRSAADDEERDTMLSIWSLAYSRVVMKRGFKPNTIAIFQSHVIEGNPVAQVAAEFKTSAMAVYQIKDRVVRAVRAEIENARPEGGGLDELYETFLRSSSKKSDASR